MLYSTIVEKNEQGLQMIIEAAEKFEEGKYLNAIYDCHLSKDEVLGVTEYVREYKSKLSREHLALAKFALTFNKKYATDNNKCFDSAEKLFNKIRSTISGSKKIYKKFCRTVRKQLPPTAEQHPSVFKRSELVNNYYSEQLFGFETYDMCVQTLYKELEEFFMELIKSMALCQMIIFEESAIRNNPEQCINIYNKCYDEMLNNSRMMVRTFKEHKIAPDSEMERRKKQAGSLPEFICANYHKPDISQWQIYVVKSELSKGNDMTDVEKILFGADNEELVQKARIAILHFDELEKDAHKGKHRDKHSAYCVASFMLWCGIGTTQDAKVKLFVEEYFNKTYKGDYPPVKTNAVNNAKNTIMYKPTESSLDHETFQDKIERIIDKYAPKDESSMRCAVNF